MSELVTRYGNYFYFYALHDPVESGVEPSVLVELADAIRFHESDQTEVLDRIYLGDDDLEQYVAAGRLLPAAAHARLAAIVQQHDATSLRARGARATGGDAPVSGDHDRRRVGVEVASVVATAMGLRARSTR